MKIPLSLFLIFALHIDALSNVTTHIQSSGSRLVDNLATPDTCQTKSAATAVQNKLLLSGDIETNPGLLNREFGIVHVDVRSLSTNIDLLAAESEQLDTITVSETWLSPAHDSNQILLPNYHPPLGKDRPNDPHGGVSIYVKNILDGNPVLILMWTALKQCGSNYVCVKKSYSSVHFIDPLTLVLITGI